MDRFKNGKMNDDELDAVAGGEKVLVICKTKYGWQHGYRTDYQGDISEIEAMAKEGNWKGIKGSAKWTKTRFLKEDYIDRFKENCANDGFKIIECVEKTK